MKYKFVSLLFFLANDACKPGLSNCSQLCTNATGNYTCYCLLGYVLAEDEQSCNG